MTKANARSPKVAMSKMDEIVAKAKTSTNNSLRPKMLIFPILRKQTAARATQKRMYKLRRRNATYVKDSMTSRIIQT